MIPALINLIIYLLIIGILMALVYWLIDHIPIPEPINRIIKVAIVVVCALIVILLLLQLVGTSVNGLNLPKIAS
jgi:hypothetical protein